MVCFVGRPNVGKSTLFNRVVGERVAIVEDRARTTRDRIYDIAEWNGRRFIVVDTGGLETRPGDAIEERVQDQARLAIAEADVIVFVVDSETGLTPADFDAAEILRTARAPVIVAANKADNPKREFEAAEFHGLGWPETHTISAAHGRGVADLLDVVVWALPAEAPAELDRKRIEAELDGQPVAPPANSMTMRQPSRSMTSRPGCRSSAGPNVGKSSLLNALVGQERAIVSDIPGTTRDAIDTSFEWAGRTVRLIDTAGIKRRGKVASGPAAERYATLRALKAVTRSDVAVLVLDASDGLTAQDAHVAGYALEEGIGLVVAINKWDVIEKTEHTFDEYVEDLRRDAPVPEFRADRVDQCQDRPARRTRRRGGSRDRRRTAPPRADRGAQRLAARGHRAPPTAHGARQAGALLLRHAGPGRAAHVRPLRQRSGRHPFQLPALPGEPIARGVRLPRHANPSGAA